MNIINMVTILFIVILYSAPLIIIATLSIFFADKFIKNGEGKKVFYKVPIYLTLGSLLISVIVFLLLWIKLVGKDAESGMAAIYPVALALMSVTVVPIESLIVTTIVYHLKKKNK